VQSPIGLLKGLHGRPTLAIFPLIGPFATVTIHGDIEVIPDFLNGFVDFFPERHFVKFVLENLVQPPH